ncbi:nucleoside-diphosphate-sugar epimerase [Pedobacter sp. CAN_A7]|uniref:NAD-dependent epimerase/dehydratase family protein n=1 Tax=Pedobacter sp. CAN_A7 TaxID=2787722 RepID=UPI0018CBABFC
MSKNEILIVGINSFLGKAVYDHVKADGVIIGVYHVNKDNIPEGIASVKVDKISNLKGKAFGVIYLVSAYIPNSIEEDDEKLIAANILLPKKLSEFFPASRIVFCSSVSVYQNYSSKDVLSMDDVPKPNTKYALSKLWAEQIISRHKSYAILRISSMYGVGMKTNTFLPRIIKDLILNQRILLYGNGLRFQNYIHVNDVAKIMIKAGQLQKNVSMLAVDDYSYTNKDIAQMMLKYLPGTVEYTGEDHSTSYKYNNKLTHDTLGGIELTNIKYGIIKLIEWIRKEY